MSDTRTDTPDTERREAPDQAGGQRVRQVKVPGSVTGFVTPSDDVDAPASGPREAARPAANGNGNGHHAEGAWRSVRLRLGGGRGASGARGSRPAAAPVVTGPARAGRRRGLMLAGGAAAAALVALLLVVLLGRGGDTPGPSRTVAVPTLSSAPPAGQATPQQIPLRALKGVGAAHATASLRNAGARLALTVRARVPGRAYGVALVGHGVHTRGVLLSHAGPATRTLHIGWRALARYDSLTLFIRVPRHHRTRHAKPARARHGRHHARHTAASRRAAARARARRPRARRVMRLGVDRLVQASDVRLGG